MSGNIKSVNNQALLGDGGKADRIYISPTTGKVSNKPSADSESMKSKGD